MRYSKIIFSLSLLVLLASCASTPPSLPSGEVVFSQLPSLGVVEHECMLQGVDLRRASEGKGAWNGGEVQSLYTSVSTQCGNGEGGRGELASCKGNACLQFAGGRVLGVLEAHQGFVRAQRADGTVEVFTVTALRCERGISLGISRPSEGPWEPTPEVLVDDCGNFPSLLQARAPMMAIPRMVPQRPTMPISPRMMEICNNPRTAHRCRAFH